MTAGFGKVTGKAMHSHDCTVHGANVKEKVMAPRYLPNGASSVGGAHRTAVKSKNEELLIQDSIMAYDRPKIVLG